MKTLVRINKNIPITIFDEPILKNKVTHLFDGLEEQIKARFNEIVTFLEVDSADELSYDNIASLFKVYFYKSILNETVEVTFSGQGNYDVLSNIISLLSEEKLKNAIIGEPMIDAFSKAIRSIPATGFLSKLNCGSKILSLQKEFLEKSFFTPFDTTKKNNQNNYCVECECSCTCNGECNGDIKKCTSKKALEKGCSHCCECYIGPMVENFPK